jgi:hypothetical protein
MTISTNIILYKCLQLHFLAPSSSAGDGATPGTVPPLGTTVFDFWEGRTGRGEGSIGLGPAPRCPLRSCPAGRQLSAETASRVTPATAPGPAPRHDRAVGGGEGAMRAYLKAVAITVGLLGAWLALLPLVA